MATKRGLGAEVVVLSLGKGCVSVRADCCGFLPTKIMLGT